MLIAIASKTFLTSAVKDLTWLFATTTKICTNARSRRDHSLSPSYHSPFWGRKSASHQLTNQSQTCCFFFLWLPFICIYTFSAINFQGYCICSVSCYTLFNRFQLPWPLPECLNTTTLFVVSYNECIKFGTFKTTFGASRITYSAYQKMSTNRKTYSTCQCVYTHWHVHTNLKFDNKLRKFLSQIL